MSSSILVKMSLIQLMTPTFLHFDFLNVMILTFRFHILCYAP